MQAVNFKPQQITKMFLAELPERSRDVIDKRFGLSGDRRKTLEAIGQEYDITRERVRQIENLAKEQIRKSNTYINLAQTAIVELEQLIDSMGGIAEEQTLLDTAATTDQDKNHLYLLLELEDRFNHAKEDDDHHKSWFTNENNSRAVRSSLEKLYQDLDTDEILTEDQIVERFMAVIQEDLKDGHADTGIARLWLRLSKRVGKNQMKRWGRTDSHNIKTRGVRDFAYLVLREHGKPMHFRDIAEKTSEHFGKKINVATMHNELIKDSRFALVGRGLYALQDWGLYGGPVADLIAEILKAHKKPMEEDEIIAQVLEKKLVKESTIRINLKNKNRFVQDKQTRLYSLVK